MYRTKPFVIGFIFLMVNFGLLTSCAELNKKRDKHSYSRVTNPSIHIVEKGESLYDIAQQHGLDYMTLAEWNHIDSPYIIRPGQKIFFSPQFDSKKEMKRYESKRRDDSKKVEKKTESKHKDDSTKKVEKKTESKRKDNSTKKVEKKTESKRKDDSTKKVGKKTESKHTAKKVTKKVDSSEHKSNKEETNQKPDSSLEDSIDLKK